MCVFVNKKFIGICMKMKRKKKFTKFLVSGNLVGDMSVLYLILLIFFFPSLKDMINILS